MMQAVRRTLRIGLRVLAGLVLLAVGTGIVCLDGVDSRPYFREPYYAETITRLRAQAVTNNLVRGELANFRITGPQGFRPSLLSEDALSRNGWRHYWNANTVQLSPHYEAWIWATYLWLYEKTRFAPLLDRTREGIGRMMAAYPGGSGPDGRSREYCA